MRIFGRFLPVLLFGMLVLGLTIPASAQFGNFGGLKGAEPPAWSVGQSATYSVKISDFPGSKGDITATIRVALVGKEIIEGQEFHWLEIDISDMKGIPEEMGMPYKVIKVKNLTKDPKATLPETDAEKLTKKIVFQLDDQTPKEIDFMTIQNMAQGLTGQDPQLKDVKPKVETKTGKETVTVKAGKFKDAPFLWFKAGEDSKGVKNLKIVLESYVSFKNGDKSGTAEGTVHFDSKVPLFSLLKMATTVSYATVKEPLNIKIGMELTDYKMNGAMSLIKGEPKECDIFELMSILQGGMPGEVENPEKNGK